MGVLDGFKKFQDLALRRLVNKQDHAYRRVRQRVNSAGSIEPLERPCPVAPNVGASWAPGWGLNAAMIQSQPVLGYLVRGDRVSRTCVIDAFWLGPRGPVRSQASRKRT